MKNLLIKIKNMIWGVKKCILVIFIFLIIIFLGLYFLGSSSSETEGDIAFEDCNVPIISLNGNLAQYKSGGEEDWADETTSNDIIDYLDYAENNPEIKGVIFEINSSGGSGVAGQEIANQLKRMTIPTIALIKEQGLSAAYWAATGASLILASDISDVGSLGVSMSYLNSVKKNIKDGYEYVQLVSGKYKDAGSISLPLTAEEKNIFMRDIKKVHEVFINEVAKNRNLDISKVSKMADGSSMLGKDALKAGLIDEIGDLFQAKKYLTEIIKEEVKTCFVN